MYRRTDRQTALFSAGNVLPEAKREACQRSWAGPFREKVLPILLKHEDDFAELYDPEEGRPNRSVALVVGVHLLKEQNDLTDDETLGDLEHDSRWWYALDLELEEAHLSQKTLHNFRAGLIAHDKSRVVFRSLTDELIVALGIDTSKQRTTTVDGRALRPAKNPSTNSSGPRDRCADIEKAMLEPWNQVALRRVDERVWSTNFRASGGVACGVHHRQPEAYRDVHSHLTGATGQRLYRNRRGRAHPYSKRGRDVGRHQGDRLRGYAMPGAKNMRGRRRPLIRFDPRIAHSACLLVRSVQKQWSTQGKRGEREHIELRPAH